MSLTVAELNAALIDTIEDLKSQPQGTKGFPFGKKSKLTGVEASEKAAALHAKNINNHNLKQTFEKLGESYQIAPALIAGKASRESNMGQTLQPASSIYWGWGDYTQRKGEKGKSYHGFGVLQLDRIGAPFATVREELNRSLGKIKLNPYEERWVEWGLKTFDEKLDNAVKLYPKLATAEQFATALSKYNGGKKGFYYPENDAYTTGKDYANDTLIRARWFAQNWEKL